MRLSELYQWGGEQLVKYPSNKRLGWYGSDSKVKMPDWKELLVKIADSEFQAMKTQTGLPLKRIVYFNEKAESLGPSFKFETQDTSFNFGPVPGVRVFRYFLLETPLRDDRHRLVDIMPSSIAYQIGSQWNNDSVVFVQDKEMTLERKSGKASQADLEFCSNLAPSTAEIKEKINQIIPVELDETIFTPKTYWVRIQWPGINDDHRQITPKVSIPDYAALEKGLLGKPRVQVNLDYTWYRSLPKECDVDAASLLESFNEIELLLAERLAAV